jgi:hypothetical protein
MQSSMKMGEAIYKVNKQTQAGETGGDKASDNGGKEDVVDAEFEEVNPKTRKIILNL